MSIARISYEISLLAMIYEDEAIPGNLEENAREHAFAILTTYMPYM